MVIDNRVDTISDNERHFPEIERDLRNLEKEVHKKDLEGDRKTRLENFSADDIRKTAEHLLNKVKDTKSLSGKYAALKNISRYNTFVQTVNDFILSSPQSQVDGIRGTGTRQDVYNVFLLHNKVCKPKFFTPDYSPGAQYLQAVLNVLAVTSKQSPDTSDIKDKEANISTDSLPPQRKPVSAVPVIEQKKVEHVVPEKGRNVEQHEVKISNQYYGDPEGFIRDILSLSPEDPKVTEVMYNIGTKSGSGKKQKKTYAVRHGNPYPGASLVRTAYGQANRAFISMCIGENGAVACCCPAEKSNAGVLGGLSFGRGTEGICIEFAGKKIQNKFGVEDVSEPNNWQIRGAQQLVMRHLESQFPGIQYGMSIQGYKGFGYGNRGSSTHTDTSGWSPETQVALGVAQEVTNQINNFTQKKWGHVT